jgi:hypothetical protein
MSRYEESIALWAAVEAKFFARGEWRAWADRRMVEDATVPAWLSALSTASNPHDALRAIGEGRQEATRTGGLRAVEEPDTTSLRLGFLYLRHRRGETDLATLLTVAGALADGTNYDHPPCEDFYLILNEIDRGGPMGPSSKPLAGRAEDLFRPHVASALHWLSVLAVQPGLAGDGPSGRY